MLSNFTYSWILVYLITLFLFDISPGVSFVITAKNTINNKSLKMGLFTALGIATSDAMSAIIGFFFCSALNAHKTAFQYAQMLGMSYLLYVGIRMVATKKETQTFEDAPSTSKQIFDAYKSGFLYTFSNIGVATVIISIISQFYGYINGWHGYVGLLLCVPLISFFSSALVAFSCYFLKLWWLFSKHAGLMDKIAGFIIILLAITNVKAILN